jgi:hypothetical protein
MPGGPARKAGRRFFGIRQPRRESLNDDKNSTWYLALNGRLAAGKAD